jgi:PAS domain S-box-containing protein
MSDSSIDVSTGGGSRDLQTRLVAHPISGKMRRVWKDDDWRHVVDAVETPIVVLDRDLRVQRVNRAVRLLTGRPADDLAGTPLQQIGEGEPWHAAAEAAGRVLSGGTPSPAQVRDTSGRTWDLLAMPFNPDEQGRERVIVIGWDVTHATELRAELDRREQMSLMGSLVAGVAHEVRSPLFAISATVDALQQALGDAHSEYFQVLREEVDRMTALMQDLLEYGRPSPLVRRDTDAWTIVRGAVASSRVRAQAHGVPVVAQEPPASIPLFVDADRVQRALDNVIQNAIQHSPAGSEVVITVTESREEHRACAEIAVLDRGSGIRPEDLPHIFEPFYSRRRGGTGLGLSIVARIIEEHQGEVRASNRPDGGASFVIRLPVAPSVRMAGDFVRQG